MERTSAGTSDDELSPAERRANYRAEWDRRLLAVLAGEWQSADAIATLLAEPQARVLERLKDMLSRDLAERRIVRAGPRVAGKKGKRPRKHMAKFQAQFRLPQPG